MLISIHFPAPLHHRPPLGTETPHHQSWGGRRERERMLPSRLASTVSASVGGSGPTPVRTWLTLARERANKPSPPVLWYGIYCTCTTLCMHACTMLYPIHIVLFSHTHILYTNFVTPSKNTRPVCVELFSAEGVEVQRLHKPCTVQCLYVDSESTWTCTICPHVHCNVCIHAWCAAPPLVITCSSLLVACTVQCGYWEYMDMCTHVNS